MVDKFHNIVKQDSGFKSTLTFTSPSKDQHFDGLHVTEAKNHLKGWTT